VRTLVGHTEIVTSLAVGLDGKVYSGSWDRTIRVWSPDDGALLQTLEGHEEKCTVLALVVGLDGNVFSRSHICTVLVWSGDTGALLHTLTVHARIDSLAVSANGRLYGGLADGSILCWS
jgi:WD40 repeat protein